jgi:transposase
MEISTTGIDLSKTSFHVIGLNARGEIVLRKKFSRKQLLQFTSNKQTILIGMEACGGAHFLSRAHRAQGHDAKVMSTQFTQSNLRHRRHIFRPRKLKQDGVY